MARVPAVRTGELPDQEVARYLAGRYRDLVECFNRRGRLIDPDNVHARAVALKTPLTEAARRLRRKPRARKD